eukprot:scaffold451678_cov45-Prasinocladus_malaysianus.AAC.1
MSVLCKGGPRHLKADAGAGDALPGAAAPGGQLWGASPLSPGRKAADRRVGQPGNRIQHSSQDAQLSGRHGLLYRFYDARPWLCNAGAHPQARQGRAACPEVDEWIGVRNLQQRSTGAPGELQCA